MKRGLKANSLHADVFDGHERYNRYPDEKGTERTSKALSITKYGNVVLHCYNRYPDEKGTESRRIIRLNSLNPRAEVTTVTPMKRGLKDPYYYPDKGDKGDAKPRRVTTVTPMKRGLKGLSGHALPSLAHGYNRYPDEKGTESPEDYECYKGSHG